MVVLGWISIFGIGSNISAIRTFRILRPLRTINFLRGMRIIVKSILLSIPRLIDVLILFCFLLLVFGILGS